MQVYLLLAMLKMLLIPSYFSTDFEVHRNWIAITHSLPISKWYFDESSPNCTLDYPPFFAWFEYILSLLACNKVFDPKMCQLDSVNYSSERTILFQRLSVIFLSDLVYYLSLLRFFSHIIDKKKELLQFWTIVALCYGLPSLIIVDNIHFQYNALLFGIFVYSICFVQEGRLLLSGVTFAILLNFKHIFLYMAPAYFCFLLVHYCFHSSGQFSVTKFLKLATLTIIVFALSFGPFFAAGGIVQIKQILARMFPFERGLTHAYWAPNFWALYNATDKVLLLIKKKVYGGPDISSVASLTGGLVGLDQGTHQILFTVRPIVTIILSMGTSFVLSAIHVYRSRHIIYEVESNDRKNTLLMKTLLICTIHSSFANFLFAWHVHEKAILMVLIPVVLMTISKEGQIFIIDLEWMRLFAFLNIVGTYSLFPLLFRPFETPIKWILLLSYIACHSYATQIILKDKYKVNNIDFFNTSERIYLYGLAVIEFYNVFLHSRIMPNFPFLPLMTISVYTAFGIVYSWWWALKLTMKGKQRKTELKME